VRYHPIKSVSANSAQTGVGKQNQSRQTHYETKRIILFPDQTEILLALLW